MPGVFNLSVDETVKEVSAAKADGIKSILLFGLPDHKDEAGSASYDPEAPVQSAIRAIKREIADVLGVHESTVSRVTTQKYMATPRGTYELKYFFGSHVATDTGGAASSTAIRALIKQLVAAEDARAPLSDSRIAQILGEQGIVVARRTIAKYRESLQIPPVNQRKSL